MKKLKLTFLFVIIFFVKINGQENSEFVNNILLQIANDERAIYNEKLEEINKEQIWKEIVRIDTVYNDSWTRPQIIDNVFREKYGGFRVRMEEVFDTATLKANPRFMKFTKKEYSDNGDFRYVRTVFLINRFEVLKKKTPRKVKRKYKRILSKQKFYWTNSGILISDKQIALDSCHPLYQLSFYKDFTFSQKYKNRIARKCYTEEMFHHRNTGVEGDDDFFIFEAKLQGHYLHHPKGIWRIKDDELHLKAKGGETFLRFKMIKIKKKKLHLKPIGFNQEIILVRKNK